MEIKKMDFFRDGYPRPVKSGEADYLTGLAGLGWGVINSLGPRTVVLIGLEEGGLYKLSHIAGDVCPQWKSPCTGLPMGHTLSPDAVEGKRCSCITPAGVMSIQFIDDGGGDYIVIDVAASAEAAAADRPAEFFLLRRGARAYYVLTGEDITPVVVGDIPGPDCMPLGAALAGQGE